MSDPLRRSGALAPLARCGAKTRDGGECQSFPVDGASRCRMHGGSAPQVRAKAAQRVLKAKLQSDVMELGWEPVTNPAIALADLAGEMTAFKDLARLQVNELRRWETQNAMGTEDVAARVAIYTQAKRDVAGVLDKMWGRGLNEETLRALLQIQEERPSKEQAEVFMRVLTRCLTGVVDVLTNALAGVDLTPAQQAAVQAAVVDNLRAATPRLIQTAMTKEGLL